jgi:hypothetical protein
MANGATICVLPYGVKDRTSTGLCELMKTPPACAQNACAHPPQGGIKKIRGMKNLVGEKSVNPPRVCERMTRIVMIKTD